MDKKNAFYIWSTLGQLINIAKIWNLLDNILE